MWNNMEAIETAFRLPTTGLGRTLGQNHFRMRKYRVLIMLYDYLHGAHLLGSP